MKTKLVILTAKNSDGVVYAGEHKKDLVPLDSMLNAGWTIHTAQLDSVSGLWTALLMFDDDAVVTNPDKGQAVLESFLEALSADSLYSIWLDANEAENAFAIKLIEETVDLLSNNDKARWVKLLEDGYVH